MTKKRSTRRSPSTTTRKYTSAEEAEQAPSYQVLYDEWARLTSSRFQLEAAEELARGEGQPSVLRKKISELRRKVTAIAKQTETTMGSYWR